MTRTHSGSALRAMEGRYEEGVCALSSSKTIHHTLNYEQLVASSRDTTPDKSSSTQPPHTGCKMNHIQNKCLFLKMFKVQIHHVSALRVNKLWMTVSVTESTQCYKAADTLV